MKQFEYYLFKKKLINNVTYKVNIYWHKNWGALNFQLGHWKKKIGIPAGPWRKNVKLCPCIRLSQRIEKCIHLMT